MEIRSTIHATPFGMLRPVGATPPADANMTARQRADRTRDPAGETLPVAAETSVSDDREQDPDQVSALRSAATDAASELTADDYELLQRLKQRDTEVRAHEQAHVAAGGRYVTSSASYDYQTGPDGQRYAIGGEVGIDTSAVSGDPAATLEKARTVRRAALAPAEPSSQDLSVAAAATTMESNALSELNALAQVQREQRIAQSLTDEETSAPKATTHSARESVGTKIEIGAETETPDSLRPLDLRSARERLEQRIAAFFSGPESGNLSQFA